MGKKKTIDKFNETDFELKMKKRDIRKMKRSVNRIFARFNNILTTIIIGLIIALSIVAVINLRKSDKYNELQKFLVSLLIVIVFLNIFFSNFHNLTLLFQKDKFFDFVNLTIASFNIIFILIILLMIIIAFIFTKVPYSNPVLALPISISTNFITILGNVFGSILYPIRYPLKNMCSTP